MKPPPPMLPSAHLVPPVLRAVSAAARRHSVAVLRVTIGAVFLWFGGMKLVPEASPAEEMATRTMSAMTFDRVGPDVSLPLLGVMEVLIGAGLVTGLLLRPVLAVFFLHMGGTMLALVLLADEMWADNGPYPTLSGQYVLKNLVLLAAGLVIAARELPLAPDSPGATDTAGAPGTSGTASPLTDRAAPVPGGPQKPVGAEEPAGG